VLAIIHKGSKSKLKMLLDDIHFTTGVDEGQLEVELGENSCKELSI